MNKKVKVLCSMLAALLISTTLAGCGTTKTADTTAKVSKNIVVWCHLMQPEVDELDKVVQAWAKSTGNTATVQIDKGKNQDLITAALSSSAPDVMYGYAHDSLGIYQKAGIIAELPSGIIDNSKYVDTAIKAVSMDGKMYGVPISIETYGLFYNTDKVKTAPTTLDDFLAQTKTLGFQFDINNFYYSYAFLAANGGYVFKDKGKGALDATDIGLGNDGAIKGLQTLQDFVVKDKLMTADIAGGSALASFQNAKTGFYISGPWDVDGLTKAGTKFAVAPLPGMPSFVGVQAGFVNAKSANQKEAWDLTKYIQANNSAMLTAGNRIPAINSELAKVTDKNILAFVAQVKNGQPMPNISEMGQVWTPAANNLKLLTSGKATPAATGKLIHDQIVEGINAAK